VTYKKDTPIHCKLFSYSNGCHHRDLLPDDWSVLCVECKYNKYGTAEKYLKEVQKRGEA